MPDAPINPALIQLKPAEQRDWPRLRGWLAMPAVEAWWGNRAQAEAEITLASSEPSAICRMIVYDGAPVGYAQALDVALWNTPLPPEIAPGTWDADIFIGSEAHRGRGIGVVALDLLAREVFGTTLALAISLFVSVNNERAYKAYQAAGFRSLRIWHDPIAGPEWMLLRERPGR